LTAKHFKADYQINASSGFGVVRNYNGGNPEKNLLTLYPFTINSLSTLNHKDEIDHARWAPHIIVIGLGTNDFSTQLNPNEKWTTRTQLQNDFVNLIWILFGLCANNIHKHRLLSWHPI